MKDESTIDRDLEHKMAKAENLVAALQIVVFAIGQTPSDHPVNVMERNALVGIGDALEDLFAA
jgi:hypothetical protein